MHPSIYREFYVFLAPASESVQESPSAEQAESALYVMLRHKDTEKEVSLKLLGADGAPDTLIEEQIIKSFPDSAVANTLRTLYGQTRHVLKPGWSKAFGDRLYTALSQRTDSNGARLWQILIASMPPLLYTAMSDRAVAALGRHADTETPMRHLIQALRNAWQDVLHEALQVSFPPRPQELMELQKTWDLSQLLSLSALEFGQLKDKAMMALLALGYLSDSDWVAMIRSLLADSHTAPNHG